ncbi:MULTISPECIES: YbaB/EbfC family nucleoid-associated protein [unclassified Streptomyces]|uniref:YbaB/EbfC family nucleoid-associated protein n=1 Tax=unclassified Streptomyces TaxID=2593676 RepID=UPI00382E7024
MDLDGDSPGMRKLLDSAQRLRQELAKAQDELRSASVHGTAGGGTVRATVDGQGTLQDLRISSVVADPGNAQGLAAMIVAAVRDAQESLVVRQAARMTPVLDALRTDVEDLPR